MSADAANTVPPVPAGARGKQPLDEVMLAMDVVDTLRRRERLVKRELDDLNREQDLKGRLRKIYETQGIEVPDHIIEEGVAALEEDRFVYKPPSGGLDVKLARVYVRRGDWGKWVLGGIAVLIVAWVLTYFVLVAPDASLPDDLAAAHAQVLEIAKSDNARETAERLLNAGRSSLRDEDADAARVALKSLEDMQTSLEQEYRLRIVNRPGEKSGVWRVPDVNTRARNYYIIVEAVDPTGSVLAQSIPAGDIVELGAMIDFVVAAPMRATVPDLIELPEQEARRQVEVAELTVGTVAETESRRQPGIVVTQSERAGSRVPLGTRIDLLVSVPVMVVVPDLTERSEQEARGLLEGLELRLGNVASQEARQPVGSVLSQRPAAGSRVPIGTGVDLMVAEPVTVPVPDLVGQPEGRARQQLSDFELAVGSTSRRESRQQTGNVLAQSIEPGVRVVIGTSLDLVIAEPVRVTVPEVVGRSEADATAAITAVELTVGEVSYQESAALPGTVLTQSLNPGTQAQIGSAVNLLIAVIETVRVPEIVGNTVEEARRTLVTGRLAVGTEELRETRVEPEGTIMEQSRAAGTAVAVGTSINLVVAAPEIITVPSVIGLGEEEATAVILGAGLVVGVVGESLSVQAGGIVLEQGQEAGSQVVFGTPIALQVARDRTIWAVPAGFLLFVLVIGAVVARLSSKRSRRPRAPRDEPPADGTEVPEFEVRTVTDPGSQTMDTGSEPAAALEMRLRPHLDAGVQRIRASGELIAEEQREQRRSEDE